jgi:hypothetical protein
LGKIEISHRLKTLMNNFVESKKCDLFLYGLKTKLQILIGTKNLLNLFFYTYFFRIIYMWATVAISYCFWAMYLARFTYLPGPHVAIYSLWVSFLGFECSLPVLDRLCSPYLSPAFLSPTSRFLYMDLAPHV